MQNLTETHLVSQAELESVIDFLSGYPVSNRSLWSRGNVDTAPCTSVPFNDDLVSDSLVGFVPPQQWPSSSCRDSNSWPSSSSRSYSPRRNGLGRSSWDTGTRYHDYYQENLTPSGYGCVDACDSPVVRGRWFDNRRPRGRLGRARDGLDCLPDCGIGRQGMDPTFLLQPYEHNIWGSTNMDTFSGLSHQSRLSTHQNSPGTHSRLQQSDAVHGKISGRSPATWPRGTLSLWADASSYN